MRHAGLSLCSPCWQRPPGRPFIGGEHLRDRLTDPPTWLGVFVAHFAARHCVARASGLITDLGRILEGRTLQLAPGSAGKTEPWIKVSPLGKQAEPENLVALKAEIERRWGTIDLIDILKEAEFATGFTGDFTSVATREAVPKAVLRRRLLVVADPTELQHDLDRMGVTARVYRDDPTCSIAQKDLNRDKEASGAALSKVERVNDQLVATIHRDKIPDGSTLVVVLPSGEGKDEALFGTDVLKGDLPSCYHAQKAELP